MSTLNLYSLTMAHGDATANNNPALRFVDWKRAINNIQVENPRVQGISVPPGVTMPVILETRTLAVDNTTEFELKQSPLAADLYRLTCVDGTSPAFRVPYNINLAGLPLTLTAQSNGSLHVAITTGGTPLSALDVGAEVFIPGVTTGDPAGLFNVLNQGTWKVLGVGSDQKSMTLVRDGTFEGASEAVTPAANSDVLIYTSNGVQAGETLEIVENFASSALKSYEIVRATPDWVEFRSTSPLAEQTGVIPGADAIEIYPSARRFLRVEVDQEASLTLNGQGPIPMSPWAAGDPDQVAEFMLTGSVWGLFITNKSAVTLHATVISAE